MDAVNINNVNKSYNGKPAVQDLSLEIPEHSIYGFIGPNGSGKTTTMRMLLNIIYPDSGQIEIFGTSRVGCYSDDIGYLPEERGLYKKMTVKDALLFFGSLKNGKNLKSEARAWLKRFDLSDYANKKVETLSKGMSQKVQFISAVLAKPRLLILDEPFSGLDPVNTDLLREAVLKLRDHGTTIISSTHDMNVAEKLCDTIFMIFKGKKVLDGTLESIQWQYGQDTLRIRCERDFSDFRNIPGVIGVNDLGQTKELRLDNIRDPQDIVKEIMVTSRVLGFEISSPSLHDIFLRIARPEDEVEEEVEVSDA